MSFFGPTLDQLGIVGTSQGGTYDAPIGLTDTSTWEPGNLSIDPTNTGDTGVIQDTSTPLFPSLNNPETGGSSTLGDTLNNLINTGFAAWQLSSQPKGTPKTVTTTVGKTVVTSGAAPSVLSSIFGGSTAGAQSNLLPILILIVVGLLIYKAVK